MDATLGEPLIEALNRSSAEHGDKAPPQICYVPQMGAIQSCDTCMVKVNGTLVRACATPVTDSMMVESYGLDVDVAQREAFDRILQNHNLYCTVCDNNNQNCTVHNATAELDVKHQARPYREKPYAKDMSNPLLSLRPRPVHPVRALRGGVAKTCR